MKILLADDHALFRDGMRELLGRTWPGLQLLETATYNETLTMLQNHTNIDLILLDLSMPGADYIHGIRSVCALASAIPLVVISARQSQEVIHAVLKLGVRGYIPKSSNSSVMAHAIDLVLNGSIYVPEQALGEAVGNSAYPLLTGRQKQVLSLLTEGLGNKDICRQLGISERTVKMHISALMDKFGVRNRTQLAIMAIADRG